MKKRILSLLLALVMLVGLVPEMSISASAEVTNYNVFVGETQITSANAADVFGNGTVSYNHDSKTLTLNGYSNNGAKNGFGGIIYAQNQNLTIKLKGENTLTGDKCWGIRVSGNLTICDDTSDSSVGSLSMIITGATSASGGIYNRGALTIENVNISIDSEGWSEGIYIPSTDDAAIINCTLDIVALAANAISNPNCEMAISDSNITTKTQYSGFNRCRVTLTNTSIEATSIDSTAFYEGTLTFTEGVGKYKVYAGASAGTATEANAPTAATYTGNQYVKIVPPIRYTVTANPTEGGTVTGLAAGGTYNHGDTVTLTATPDDGYRFVNWTENDVEVSNSTTYSFAAEGDRNLVANFESTHPHPQCKAQNCTVEHPNSDWKDLSESIQQNGATFIESGNYYLNDNITDDIHINNGSTVYLCLNGHTLSSDNFFTIRILGNATLYLCDCKGGGLITNTDTNGNAVLVGDTNSQFIMHGGSISNTSTYSAAVNVSYYSSTGSGAQFTMYGGNISNRSTGGAVCVKTDTSFTMKGGTITNTQDHRAYPAVYVGNGTFTVSGAVNINRIKLESGSKITIGEGGFTPNQTIKVNASDYGKNYPLTSGWSANMGFQAPGNYLVCDNGDGDNFYLFNGEIVKLTPGQAPKMVTAVTLSETTLELGVLETATLTATVYPGNATTQTLLWSSSNETVATVDQDGKVTAKGSGTAIITAAATDGSGKSASCTVTVPFASYELWVAGEQITSDKLTVTCGEGTASYNPVTKTLTLNNAAITGSYNNANIYASENLNIVLEGSNSLTSARKGIKVDGANTLTISGTGTLNIQGHWDGIKVADGSVVITGANITSIAESSYGVHAAKLTIDNSVVTIEGGVNAVALTCSDVTFGSNCHVKITSKGNAAFSTEPVTDDGWYRNNVENGFGNEMVSQTGYFEYLGKNHVTLTDKQDDANHTVSCAHGVSFEEAHQYAEGSCVCGAKKTYTVTLNTNGGTVKSGDVSSYTYSVGATLPTDVTKTGYTFDGWYENADFSGSAVTVIGTAATGSKTYYAKWNVNTYDVSLEYVGEDGSATLTSGATVKAGDTITVTVTPDDGYAVYCVDCYSGGVYCGEFTGNGNIFTFVTPEDAYGTDISIHVSFVKKNLSIIRGEQLVGYYASLEHAIDCIADGDVIKVECEYTEQHEYVCLEPDDSISYTIDLNGNKIHFLDNFWKDVGYLELYSGNITLTDSIGGGFVHAMVDATYADALNVTGGTYVALFAPNVTELSGGTFTGMPQEAVDAMMEDPYWAQFANMIGTKGVIHNSFFNDEVNQDRDKAIEAFNSIFADGYVCSNGYGVYETQSGYYLVYLPANSTVVKTYTVTYKADGNVVKTVTVKHGENATAPEIPAKTGYTGKWEPKSENITANTEINAIYTINQYTITFNTDGGSKMDAITQDYGTAVTAPADPTKTGYTFAGWDAEIPATMPAENVTIKANWTINKYTVTYKADGKVVGTVEVEYGKDATAPEIPAKTGYTAAWSTDGKNITADTEINAVYTINKYNVTYKADGKVVKTVEVEHGKDATAPEIPAKEGYNETAPKWDKDGKNITADTEINAVYTINKYTVTYKADGKVVKTVEVEHGKDATAPEIPAKEGYNETAPKWDKDGKNITANTEINAVYTKNQPGEYADVTPDTNVGGGKVTEEIEELKEKVPFTQEEEKQIEHGADVEVWLEIKDISDSVSAEDKAKVDEKLGDADVALYLDIAMFKQVGENEASRLSKLSDKVKITFKLADDYINTDKNVTRTYSIIHVHDGKAEIITPVFDAATKTLTFETDRFSTYGVVYTDEKITPPTEETTPPTEETVPPTQETVPPTEETVPPTEETVPPTEETVPPTEETVPPTEETTPPTEETVPPTEKPAPPADTPATGDSFQPAFWIACMTLSIFGIAVLLLDAKRRHAR